MSTTASLQHQRHDAGPVSTVLNGAFAKSVVMAVADEFSRRIISSTVEEGKTVQEISVEQAVPLSTCYRRASDLAEKGLLMVERIVVTGEGKRYAVYRSSFRSVQITSNLDSVSATAELNPDVAEKFHRVWLSTARPVEQHDPSSWTQ